MNRYKYPVAVRFTYCYGICIYSDKKRQHYPLGYYCRLYGNPDSMKSATPSFPLGWGNPLGASYCSFAHRMAYPLIFRNWSLTIWERYSPSLLESINRIPLDYIFVKLF